MGIIQDRFNLCTLLSVSLVSSVNQEHEVNPHKTSNETVLQDVRNWTMVFQERPKLKDTVYVQGVFNRNQTEPTGSKRNKTLPILFGTFLLIY